MNKYRLGNGESLESRLHTPKDYPVQPRQADYLKQMYYRVVKPDVYNRARESHGKYKQKKWYE